jgi:phosphate starvation-inducible PhoH-like protein
MAHRVYQLLLENPRLSIVIASGPAGTGKTFMACKAAPLGKRIVMTRPAVSVDEQHGFLPGNINKKMEPWVRPMADALNHRSNQIEVCPLAYMRGRTFDDSWIIADEMQNSTPNQMKMVMTRLGKDSKLIITGDVGQHDRGFENNGLEDLIQRLQDYPVLGIGHVQFSEKDVKRHPIIRDVLKLYDK